MVNTHTKVILEASLINSELLGDACYGSCSVIQDKVYILQDCAGIENIFMLSDLKLVDPKITSIPNNDNAKYVQEHGGKELFARLFLDKVNAGTIDVSKLTKHSIEEFGKVFDAIEKRFKGKD